MIHLNECDNTLEFFWSLLHYDRADLYLLAGLCAESCTAEQMGALFSDVHMDSEEYNRARLLAHLAMRENYTGVPNDEVARLRGISSHTVLRNAKLIKGAVDVARALAKEGIPTMMCKGVALRLGYMQHQSRGMGDSDIAVPEKLFARAREVARTWGRPLEYAGHSVNVNVDVHVNVDIHQVFHKTSLHRVSEEGIWRRSRTVLAHGVEMRLPSAEDMLIQVLCNEFSNIVLEDNMKTHLRWVYDCYCVMKSSPGLDWPRVMSCAREVGVGDIVGLMAALMYKACPDAFTALWGEAPALDRRGAERLMRHHGRGVLWFRKYHALRIGKPMRNYILYWPLNLWYLHKYCMFGEPWHRILLSFPASVKNTLGVRKWISLPKALVQRYQKRKRLDINL